MNRVGTTECTRAGAAAVRGGRQDRKRSGPSGAAPDATDDDPLLATPAIAVTGLSKSFGTTEVLHDIDLTVPPGGVVALLGPSGCGKTTLLRTIAGLERPAAGEVTLFGRRVSGPSVHVPAEKRKVGMVFQDWALFPHMSVAQNVGYGLARADRRGPRIDDVLDMVGLAGLGERLPSTLSGGQQQRVALARALAPRPKVLLLDEPFSNLDTSLRTRVRSEVHQLLAELGITTVFVTHDQEEAFVLGDEVAVMHTGRIVQHATPAELYAHPATAWVATFVGDANLVDGESAGGEAGTPLGRVRLDRPAPTGAVQVLLRPEELRLDGVRPGGATPGVRTLATVELHEYYGHDTVYLVRPDSGPLLRVRAGSVPQFRRGDRVAVRYVGPPAVAYPAETVGDGPDPGPADGDSAGRDAVPAADRGSITPPAPAGA